MLTLRVISILLFLILTNRFYSDNVDLSKQNDVSDDNKLKEVEPATEKKNIGMRSSTEKNEGKNIDAGDVDDPTAGFYRVAYDDFSKRYNTNLSPAEEKYLNCEPDGDKSTLQGVMQITLRAIRDGDSCEKYKRVFYSSDKYFLYRPVYELYSPYEVLFSSSFRDRDCKIEIESGYRRFDFLKRDKLDMPINDTKSPIIRITSAVDVYKPRPRGCISSFEYSFSANRNTHLGLIWDIVPLTRFYNGEYFWPVKDDGSEDRDKPCFSYNFNYLFFSPFYFHALYKSDDESFISYFHVSYKIFKVDESGGSSINDSVGRASSYSLEGSRASKFDIITSMQESYSAFFFLQYKFVKECRCYFLFDFSKEKNEVEIKKDTDANLPPAIKEEMKTLKEKFDRNDKKVSRYFNIIENTIKTLGLDGKKLENKNQYSSSSRFSKSTFDFGFENIPFSLFNFDIFTKLSICRFPSQIDEYIDSNVINNSSVVKRVYEPIVGFVVRRDCVQLRAEMLFKDFKLDPYFKCLFEVKKTLFIQLLKITTWINSDTVFDILNSGVNKLEESKVLHFWMYLLSRGINIRDIFSFSFLTRILVTPTSNCVVKKVANAALNVIPSVNNSEKQNQVTGSIKNDSLVTCNLGLKIKIKITKHFFTRALIFFNKKTSIKNNFNFSPSIKGPQESYDNLPLFSFFIKIYYKRRMVDDYNSFLAYGLRVRYDTPCHLDEFNIIKQQWCDYDITKDLKKDKYKYMLPVVDLFLNLRLGLFDISWEVTDLIQAFSGYTSILSPHYLRKPWSPFNIIISFVTLD